MLHYHAATHASVHFLQQPCVQIPRRTLGVAKQRWCYKALGAATAFKETPPQGGVRGELVGNDRRQYDVSGARQARAGAHREHVERDGTL